jgi:hypothetical protein
LRPDRDLGERLPPAELGLDFPRPGVVIAFDEVDVLAADAAAILSRTLGGPQTEVTQEVEIVLFPDRGIQVFEDGIIHFGHGQEWPLAVPDDVPVSKMKVGSEPSITHGSLT